MLEIISSSARIREELTFQVDDLLADRRKYRNWKLSSGKDSEKEVKVCVFVLVLLTAFSLLFQSFN